MKIVVTGGTGFIGRPLCRLLSTNGHDVILITRQSDLRPAPIDAGVTSVRWDGITRGSWEHALNGAGAVGLQRKAAAAPRRRRNIVKRTVP